MNEPDSLFYENSVDTPWGGVNCFCKQITPERNSELTRDLKRLAPTMGLVVALTLVLATTPGRTQDRGRDARTWVVTINLDPSTGKVEVYPQTIRTNLGDIVQYRTTTPDAEFRITFVNPFTDDGMMIQSTNGEWTSPPIKWNVGSHGICVLIVNGKIIPSEYGVNSTPGDACN
jgi:hypothetical protein